MGRTPQCFLCARFAKLQDCVLLRNKSSGVRRWFHRSCTEKWPSMEYWEEVDPALGETTDEEERKLAGLNSV